MGESMITNEKNNDCTVAISAWALAQGYGNETIEHEDGTEILLRTPYVISAGAAQIAVDLPTTVMIEEWLIRAVTEIDLPRVEDVENIDTLQNTLSERVAELEKASPGSRMTVPLDDGVLWLGCEHQLPEVDPVAALEIHLKQSRNLYTTIIAEFLVPPAAETIPSHLRLVK